MRVLALLAAAYVNDASLADVLGDGKDAEGQELGAILRYRALNDLPIDPARLAEAFNAKRQPRGPAGPSYTLTDCDLLVPSQVLACEAVGLTGDAAHLALVHEQLESRDIRVRYAALRAMESVADAASLPLLNELLKNASWAEVVPACAALRMIPHESSFPALIERLEDEKGRLRLDIMYTLNVLYGERSFKQDAAAWKSWYESPEGQAFTVDPERSRAYREANGLFDNQVPTLANFYGLNIYSDRLVFVLDTSLSMKGDKIADLRENTVMMLESFPRHVQYNMVDFGGTITVLYPGGLINDPRTGIEWAREMPMSFGTRSFDAMERGARFDDMDTIYFLSDGAPVASQSDDWASMHALCLLMNRFRPLAMFTVCFKAGPANASAMQTLADQNFGQSTNID